MRWALGIGAFYGMTAVALGAFGAHALRERLDASSMAVFQTAVQYQMWHGLAIILCALLRQDSYKSKVACIFLSVGVVLFSGSLYALALTGIRKMGMITPVGGACFIAGWAFMMHAVRDSSADRP